MTKKVSAIDRFVVSDLQLRALSPREDDDEGCPTKFR